MRRKFLCDTRKFPWGSRLHAQHNLYTRPPTCNMSNDFPQLYHVEFLDHELQREGSYDDTERMVISEAVRIITAERERLVRVVIDRITGKIRDAQHGMTAATEERYALGDRLYTQLVASLGELEEKCNTVLAEAGTSVRLDWEVPQRPKAKMYSDVYPRNIDIDEWMKSEEAAACTDDLLLRALQRKHSQVVPWQSRDPVAHTQLKYFQRRLGEANAWYERLLEQVTTDLGAASIAFHVGDAEFYHKKAFVYVI